MSESRKKSIICLIISFIVGCAATAGAAALIFNGAFGYVKVSKTDYEQMERVYSKYGKLESLYQNLDEYYYKDINEEDLITGACKGLVAGLNDPYSSYMTAEEYDSWKASATGNYSGIGVTFTQDSTGYIIIDVQEGSPADKGGLEEGDYIISVDGKAYDDMELMANNIRGKAGTTVEITYYHDGKEKISSFLRKSIVQESVSYKMIDENTGYIQITGFLENTADDFHNALKIIEKDGAENLVLDVRDNGGGLVDSCIDIADEFLDKGVVTYVEDKNKNRKDYMAEDGKTELETVVLVNENSASASEILAAALQDNGVKIVGMKTYGKGVIQSTSELSDGSALKLTVMQYFSPDGNAVNKKGIKPDYVVENEEDSDEDKQLEKALSLF